MSASNDNRSPDATARIGRLSQEVWHRRSRTPGDRRAVNWLRSQADERSGFERYFADGELEDKSLDGFQNAWVTTTFIGGELASTLRIHVANGESDYLPSLDVFGDVLKCSIREGETILETTRAAARLEISQRVPEMPYIALRSAWLAAEYFETDFVISTVREKDCSFYQRAFGYERWSEPRACPGLKGDLTFIGLNFSAAKDRVEAKFPFLRSSPEEREALFRRWSPPRAVLAAG